MRDAPGGTQRGVSSGVNGATSTPAGSPRSDFQRLAGPATFTLGAQAVRVVSTMALTVLVSRFLGAEALGLLTLGLTLAATGTIIACVGVDQGVIYFVARAQPAHTPGPIPGTPSAAKRPRDNTAPRPLETSSPAAIRSALIIASLGGLAVGAAAWLLAPVVANTVFEAPELRPILLILVPSIPVAAVFAAALGALQGAFRVSHRAIIEWIVFPCLTLSLAVGLLLSGRGIEGVAVGYLLAWTTAATIAVVIALRIKGDHRPLILRRMLVFSFPLMLSLLTGYLLFHIDVLMLGWLSSVREVGLYGVATRLALPLFLVLASVVRALAPLAAQLYAEDQIERLGNVYASATDWILAINAPACVFILFYAEPVLGLFGEEFVAGADALRVLSLGVAFATICGGAAQMLIMTRWQRLEMIDNVVLLAINVVLNLVLVPRLGALGAALATASAASFVYGLKVLQVRWLLSVQPFRPHQATTVALALASAAISWLSTQSFIMDGSMKLALRVVIFTAVYGPLWWRWGCSADSREVLRSVGRRLI